MGSGNFRRSALLPCALAAGLSSCTDRAPDQPPAARSEEAIAGFWSWFAAHTEQLGELVHPDEPFWDTALKEIKTVDARLCFELSKPDGKERDFVIAAQGDPAVFGVVETMVARAPAIPGWRWTALRQPHGFDFKLTFEAVPLDPQGMWFLPRQGGNMLPADLRIAVPGFAEKDRRTIQAGVLLILDMGLGEKSAAADLGRLDVGPVPTSPEEAGYRKLADLPRYLGARGQPAR